MILIWHKLKRLTAWNDAWLCLALFLHFAILPWVIVGVRGLGRSVDSTDIYITIPIISWMVSLIGLTDQDIFST